MITGYMSIRMTGMIVYCCHDLIFATKIGSTAQAVGVAARPARAEQKLLDRLREVDDGRLNEPVSGVIIDLAEGDLAIEFLRRVKEHDANIPVVAFGSHVEVELLESARTNGADFVLPRSQFTAQLPALIERLGGTG